MATISNMLIDTCKPTFRPEAARRLVAHLLAEYSPELGRTVVTALLEVVPMASGRAILDPLRRGGTRIAYQIIKLSFPHRIFDPERLEPLRRLSRLFAFVDAELARRSAIGHRTFVAVFRERLRAYFALANAVRDLSSREPPNPALLGCLVERVLVAGAAEVQLTGLLAASMMREADRRERATLSERVEATIPVAMANPYTPLLDDEDRAAGQDILLDTIAAAEPTSLASLLDKVSVGTFMAADSTSKPGFSGALLRNPHFQAAVRRVPVVLRQQMCPK